MNLYSPVKSLLKNRQFFQFSLNANSERHHKQGLFDDEFYKEWITKFAFSPPENLPNARSLIVVAAPQPQFQVTCCVSAEMRHFVDFLVETS